MSNSRMRNITHSVIKVLLHIKQPSFKPHSLVSKERGNSSPKLLPRVIVSYAHEEKSQVMRANRGAVNLHNLQGKFQYLRWERPQRWLVYLLISKTNSTNIIIHTMWSYSTVSKCFQVNCKHMNTGER